MLADIQINLSKLAEYGGVLLTVSASFALIWRPIKNVLNRYDKTLKGVEEQLSQHAQLLNEQERINASQDESATSLKDALAPISHGMQQILRFRLQRECERINRRGFITQREYEDLYHIHSAYEALGQNGLITSVYREAISQPRKEK